MISIPVSVVFKMIENHQQILSQNKICILAGKFNYLCNVKFNVKLIDKINKFAKYVKKKYFLKSLKIFAYISCGFYGIFLAFVPKNPSTHYFDL